MVGLETSALPFRFGALERSGKDDFDAQKGDIHTQKGDMVSIANKEGRNNQELQKHRTLPSPPLQGGDQRPRRLTARETRALNQRVYELQHCHIDQFGHQRYDKSNIPILQLNFGEAVELACKQLMLPIESAWLAAAAAGLVDAKKEPHAVSA
jgi:hypothetical protein